MKAGWWWVVILLLVCVGWKITLLVMDLVPFNADEAIVGLMARHILQGNLPIFFYGQSYMGSLDAFLVAVGFFVLGEAVWVIRLVQILLYAGVLLTTIWLGKEAFGSVRLGILAAALLAIPTVNVSLYTTVSLGGYGEAMLIGNFLLILAIRLSRQSHWSGWLWMGLLAGFGLWANGLTLVFSVPCIIYLGYTQFKRLQPGQILTRIGVLILGGCLGALPWWIYGWQNGMTHLISELLGSAVSVEQVNWFSRSAGHLVNLLLLGVPAIFGLRPPWAVSWLAVPLLPVVLVCWGLILVHYFSVLRKDETRRPIFALFGGIGLVLFSGFLFTSFGVDPSGRYFLPLAVPLALLAADFALNSPAHLYLRTGCVGMILVFQIWGNIQSALAYPPGFTTQFDASTIVDHSNDQALIQFLRSYGLTSGYSNYWVAYPLAFLTGESLIYVPRLPYHQDLRYTSRDDRYEDYRAVVTNSDQVAYITVNNPLLDERLKAGFEEQMISWSEEWVGEYHIFYNLSRPVRPEEMNIYQPSP